MRSPDVAAQLRKIAAALAKDLEDVRALVRGQSPEIDLAVVRARLSELQDLLDDSTLVPLLERLLAETARARPRASSARRRST